MARTASESPETGGPNALLGWFPWYGPLGAIVVVAVTGAVAGTGEAVIAATSLVGLASVALAIISRSWATGIGAVMVTAAIGALLAIRMQAWDDSGLGEDLRRAVLKDRRLAGRDLTRADMQGARADGAVLAGARLTGARLNGAELRDANLRGSYLQHACLRGADLTGARLQGADVTGSDRRGAMGVDLTGAIGTRAAPSELACR